MKKHMEPITKLKKDELQAKLVTLRADINEARRSVYTGEAQNHQMIRAKRRELARVYTALNKAEEVKESKPKTAANKEAK